MKIAFLGLGAMGSRMATRLCAAGHELTVWNRSEARATPEGAVRAPTPTAAAEGADLVISMVRDDAASRDVWLGERGALAAMSDDAIGVECSTLSLPYVKELAAAFRNADRQFLDAPLAGSRPQAEAGQLIFMVGGREQAVEAARPALEAMGGAIHYAGGNGAGATVKLMVNALFGVQVAVLAELIGLARASGIDAAKAVEILGATPVASPAAKAAAAAMLAGNFTPAFPIDLVAKDFGLIDASTPTIAVETPVSGAAGVVYRRGVSAGLGADNITGIVQLYRGEEAANEPFAEKNAR
ncbi:MAG: NAD(P)-dependent oxidoreductase [Rhizobiales bacterium]|nr:NAD(P)-dependent oxidoreductase [Hyphomicrobiales bacterium]